MSSGSSLLIMRMATPLSAIRSISLWIWALAPTSMPRVGSSSMSSRGAVLSHLPSTHFCWLPPLKVATSCSLERATMLSCWISSAVWRSSLGVDRKPRVETERREARLKFSRIDMGGISPSVFGPRKGRPCLPGSAGPDSSCWSSGRGSAPRRRGTGAPRTRTWPVQCGHPHEAAHLQHRLRMHRVRARVHLVDGSPGHHPNHRIRLEFLNWQVAHPATVAQHREAIADGPNFLEAGG